MDLKTSKGPLQRVLSDSDFLSSLKTTLRESACLYVTSKTLTERNKALGSTDLSSECCGVCVCSHAEIESCMTSKCAQTQTHKHTGVPT